MNKLIKTIIVISCLALSLITISAMIMIPIHLNNIEYSITYWNVLKVITIEVILFLLGGLFIFIGISTISN